PKHPTAPTLRHHPRPPLSPYTTLFRSQQVQSRWKVRNNQRRLDVLTEAIALGACVNHGDIRCASQDNRHTNTSVCGDIQYRNNRDRKSTRLNSSHVSISYAVFCLKKNK